MSDPMYSLAYDSDAGIIRMSVTGFWTPQTVDALTAELIPLLTRVKASGVPVLVLSDSRDFPVQSSEVGEAFARMDAQAGQLRDRMAMVVGSMLNKMQARRAAGGTMAFFGDADEAEAWLVSGGD